MMHLGCLEPKTLSVRTKEGKANREWLGRDMEDWASFALGHDGYGPNGRAQWRVSPGDATYYEGVVNRSPLPFTTEDPCP